MVRKNGQNKCFESKRKRNRDNSYHAKAILGKVQGMF